MANVLTELTAFLDAFGDVGTLAAGTIVLNRLPDGDDTPAPITCLTERPGQAGERNFGASGLAREKPNIQVTVRGAVDQQAAARVRIEDVKNHLVTIMAQTVGGTFYHWVNELSGIGLAGWDPKRRPLFTWNAFILKELS